MVLPMMETLPSATSSPMVVVPPPPSIMLFITYSGRPGWATSLFEMMPHPYTGLDPPLITLLSMYMPLSLLTSIPWAPSAPPPPSMRLFFTSGPDWREMRSPAVVTLGALVPPRMTLLVKIGVACPLRRTAPSLANMPVDGPWMVRPSMTTLLSTLATASVLPLGFCGVVARMVWLTPSKSG